MKSLTEYRERMVSEAVIGTNIADHWSRFHPYEQPLLFDNDLRDSEVNRRGRALEPESEHRTSLPDVRRHRITSAKFLRGCGLERSVSLR